MRRPSANRRCLSLFLPGACGRTWVGVCVCVCGGGGVVRWGCTGSRIKFLQFLISRVNVQSGASTRWGNWRKLSKNVSRLSRFFTSGRAHTTSKKCVKAALFLRLDLPVTLVRHKDGAFRKRSSNRRNLKTLEFCFSVDMKTELFENDDVTIIVWFPCPKFPQTLIQNDRWQEPMTWAPAGDCRVFYILLRPSVNENVMRFQCKHAVSKFLWPGVDVDGASVEFKFGPCRLF